MKIYKSIFNDLNIKKNGIIAIGYFDSMHLGHKKLLSELLRISYEKKMINYVLTYKNLPLKKNHERKILPLKYKLNIMKKMGVKNIILSDFTKDFYTLKPVEFLNFLKKNFNINEYVVSENFKFGYKKSGNIRDLKESGCVLNFVKSIYIKKQIISTSVIKELILNGKIEEANLFLGAPFFINGIVRKGKQLGRKLGFPTMNIYNENILYPHNGVYITKTYIKEKQYLSMTHIIYPIIETYLLGYDKFHYNYKIKVDFLKKIRDNIDFKSNLLLKRRLEEDLLNVREFFNKLGEVDDNL